MNSVFKVDLSQDVGVGEYSAHRESLEIAAVNAVIAGRKALRLARSNGWMKSRPVEIESIERIVRDAQ